MNDQSEAERYHRVIDALELEQATAPESERATWIRAREIVDREWQPFFIRKD